MASLFHNESTHWVLVLPQDIFVNMDSNSGLLPDCCQAITWNNTNLLSTGLQEDILEKFE